MSNFFRRRSRPYAPEGGLRLRGLPNAQCPMPNAQLFLDKLHHNLI
ncbi:MAG: hypothetical protein F6J93_25500 [Oscillatoria sp. SIO1A7]|nr:hypothetical protein [Oscillatoria sp. SIO1A7]